MGLDIYAGTLTRYYANDWETVVQKWAQENDYDFHFVDPDGNPISRAQEITRDDIQEIIEKWRDQVCASLLADNSPFEPWTEDASKPYYTDKPDWLAYGALLLCIACTALGEPIPAFVTEDWAFEEDVLVKKALSAELLTGSLMTGVPWWLPIKEAYSFRFPTPTGASIRIGTTGFLLDELQWLNKQLWQATDSEICAWSQTEGYSSSDETQADNPIRHPRKRPHHTQSLAKLSFSILWQAATFSLKHQVPIILDPWQGVQDRIHAALFDLQNEAFDLSQQDDHEQALAILHGIEKHLSKKEPTFPQQCVFYGLGNIYALLDEYDKAFSYTKQSLAIETYPADAYTLLGILYKNEEAYNLSADHFQMALFSRYTEGAQVLQQFTDENIWHYMAVAMLYAYEEAELFDLLEIMRVLREVIVLAPDYYDAYQNLSLCFQLLSKKGLFSFFSKERKLARAFQKVAKNRRLDQATYASLLDALTTYIRDDDYPDFHFAVYINGIFAGREMKPSFTELKQLLTKLWAWDGETTKMKLTNAFGDCETALTITARHDLKTQKKCLFFQANLGEENPFWRTADPSSGTHASDDGGKFYREVDHLEEAIRLLTRYFYDHALDNPADWMTHAQYMKKVQKALAPAVLEPFTRKTRLSYNEIHLTKEDCTRFDSKVGGDPYMPVGLPWPQSDDGRPLRLLAQINFAQMPPLPDFPTAGILQFFVLEDDLYGLNFDEPTKQDSFRLLYHAAIDQHAPQQTPPESCFNPDYGLSLGREEYLKITYTQQDMPMTLDDFRFDPLFFPLYNQAFGQNLDSFYDLDDEISEVLYDVFFHAGHRVSGYPYFTQTDPRDEENDGKKTVLLLQLDSEDVDDISLMWGDAGVANFFISREHLQMKNFTDVLYNWDCG